MGGHDHVNFATEINGTYIIKSGSDFKEFNKITLTFNKNTTENGTAAKKKFEVACETVFVTRQYAPDQRLKEHTDYYLELFQETMKLVTLFFLFKKLIFGLAFGNYSL